MNRKNHSLHALIHEAHGLYDVVCIQEPWWQDLNGSNTWGTANPGPGWHTLLPKVNIPEAERPRVLTFYRDRPDLTIHPRFDITTDLDARFFKIRQPGQPTVLIGNIYNQAPAQHTPPPRTTAPLPKRKTTTQWTASSAPTQPP